MRTNPPLKWLIIIAAAVVVLALWFRSKSAKTSLPPAEQVDSTAGPTDADSAEGSPRGAPPGQAKAQVAAPTLRSNAAAPPGESKAEQMINVLSNYNDMPIVYYGKLEDQSGHPVADAGVDFSIHVNNGSELSTLRGRVVSDAGGLFTISGYKGADLRVVPQKSGYAISSTNRLAIYSQLSSEEERIHPDASNPVVIIMWKLQGAEPLLTFNQKYKIHSADSPIYFDLLAGKVVPGGGDLKLTVNRAPGALSGRNRLDWSVQVEAIDGGLMDASNREEITYWAPADGYQPGSTFTFSTNAPHAWAGGFNHGFFVMSRKGQIYSKVGLSFIINEDPEGLIYVGLGGVANTNRSRNWEGDPNTLKPQ